MVDDGAISTWAALEETREGAETVPLGADTVEGILDNMAAALDRVYRELDGGTRTVRDVLRSAEATMADLERRFLAPGNLRRWHAGQRHRAYRGTLSMIRKLSALLLAGLVLCASGVANAEDGGRTITEVGPLTTLGEGRWRPVSDPSALAVLGGYVYVGERAGRVQVIDRTGEVSTLASRLEAAVAGSTTDANLMSVGGLATDALYLYIADPVAHQVQMITPLGDLATAAGTGEEGVSGDGGYATLARLRRPVDVDVTEDGAHLYVADAAAHQVRMVRVLTGLEDGETLAADGTIMTIAGTGEPGYGGDGGPATEAQLHSPSRVAVDPDGRLYILESPRGGARVRMIDLGGNISTVVGGDSCDEPDRYRPLSLCDGSSDIAVDATGALYVHDRAIDAVWRVEPDGDQVRLPTHLRHVISLTVDLTDGDLYVVRRADATPNRYLVQRVPLSEPAPPVAEPSVRGPDRAIGTVTLATHAEDVWSAEPRQGGPGQLAVGPDGTVYVLDRAAGRVRSVGADGTVATVAGNGVEPPPPRSTAGPAPGDGRLATEVPLYPTTTGVAAGPDGSLFLAGAGSHRVFRVNPLGVITSFAGTGERGNAGDGGPAVDAALAEPVDVAAAPDGTVYVADRGNDRIRAVHSTGSITTVAELTDPVAVDAGPDGTVYALAGGEIWRVGPGATTTRVAADGLPQPSDLAVGPDGLVYVAGGGQVFKVRSDGTVEEVAGTGQVGDRIISEGEPVSDVDLPAIGSIAFDRAGNLYLSHPAANQVSVVVRATEEPAEFAWQWVILAAVAAVAAAAVVSSVWARRRRRSAAAAADPSQAR